MDALKVQGGRLWEWFRKRSESPHAKMWLVVLSFFEPIFSPIMPETLMVPMLLANGKHWKLYATVVVVFTTLGCAIGYFIGSFFFEIIGAKLLAFYHLTDVFEDAKAIMAAHAFLTMFWISFTPLPDKVFVLAAGFLAVPFIPYLLGCLIGRALRVFLIAYLINRYGEGVLGVVRRYFAILTVVAIVVLLVLFVGILR